MKTWWACLIMGFSCCLSCGATEEVTLPPYLDPAFRETMPPEELANWIAKWDTTVKTSLIEAPIPMTVVKISNGDYMHILEYNNPEIVERVVNLCIAEHQRELASWIASDESAAAKPEIRSDPVRLEVNEYNLSRLRTTLDMSIGLSGKLFNQHHIQRMMEVEQNAGEGEPLIEFHDTIYPTAESTLSEKLYFYVLHFEGGSELRNDYLAYVRPADTLRTFLDSEVGARDGRKISPDYFYFPGTYGTEPIDSAVNIVLHMATHNPRFRETETENIRTFVRRHALHYADPTLPTKYDPQHSERRVYSPYHDFQTRAAALKTLELVGCVEDLEFGRSVVQSPPIPPTPEPIKYRPTPVPLDDLMLTMEASILERFRP